MAQEVYNCFESYEFFGEFFEKADSNLGRFAAKVKYSPENGLQLEYSISDSESPTSCERLFGILSNGQKCTLVGPFDFDRGTQYIGKVHVKSGLNGFYYLIIGDFIEPGQLFEYTNFTFNGMQEFIHPQGWISQIKYQDEPIACINGEGWEIKVENTAIYSMVGQRLKNLVHLEDVEAQQKLEIALDEIQEEHSESHLKLRKELRYHIRYTTEELQGADKILGDITKIASLFSILMSCPVFPDEVRLRLSGENKTVNVLNSIVLEKRTIELAKNEINHNLMPLNWKQLDMHNVLSNWFNLYDEFQVLSVSHQYETGFRTLHYAHSDIILYSTQLEAVNNDLGGGSSERYKIPIDTYASPEIKLKLRNAFYKTGEEDLGKAISTLRNELAHVGRPKVFMKQLNIDDFVEIGHMLRLVIISHLFSKLGIAQDKIYQYQGRLTIE